MSGKVDLSAAIRALSAQVSDDPDDHPDAEDLAALATGTLSGFRRLAVEDHAAGCPECTAMLVDLGGVGEEEGSWVGKEGGLSGGGLEVAWGRFERERAKGGARLAETAPVVSSRRVAVGQVVPIQPWIRRPIVPWAMAAGLCLLAVGLGIHASSQGRELERRRAPQPSKLVEIFSQDTTQRGDDETPVAVLPLSTRDAQVAFYLSGVTVFSPVTLEVLDSRGDQLWRGEDLEVDEGNMVVVSIGRRWLPPGRYEARLSAKELDPPVVYSLEVR